MDEESSKNEVDPNLPLYAKQEEEENVPEWKKGEEWLNLKTLRQKFIEGDDKEPAYKNQKEIIAEKIKESLRKEAGENLTPEQEAELKSKIDNIIFDELVKGENDAYLAALRAARGETLKDKVLEKAKNLLGTKAFKWYMGLSKGQRIAVNFGVGSIAGLMSGATVAPGIVGVGGYLAWRAARAGLSGTAGALAGKWANKKWSAEELQKTEEQEKEDLKNSTLSIEEKSKGLLDIEKRFRKEKIKMNLKKIGVIAGAGAGTGFVTGLLEHAFSGVGGTARTVAESQRGSEVGAIPQDKILRATPRFGPAPSAPPAPDDPSAELVHYAEPEIAETAEVIEPAEIAEGAPDNAVMEPTIPEPRLTEPEGFEPTPFPPAPEPTMAEELAAETFFSDPSILQHEVVAGDSAWKILEKTLDHNDQFKSMTEAQKTYVLSVLTNKAMQSPHEYGFGSNGLIHIGDKTDFTKLFEDTKEIQSILDKANQTITPGGPQEASILTNNQKILEWVKAHPNEPLNEDKVTEILSTEPKTGRVKPIILKEPISPAQETLVKTPPETFLNREPKLPPIGPPAPEVDPLKHFNQDVPNKVPESLGGDKILAGSMGVGAVGAVAMNPEEAKIHKEIEDAKNRIAEIEAGKKNDTMKMPGGNPNIERTFATDSMIAKHAEEAFAKEVDNIYGIKGLFKKRAGVDTEEWKEMAKLPAPKIVIYYMGDSEESGLTPDIVEKLSKSKKHQAFMKQMAGLMEETENIVKPYENENTNQFFRRLGEHVLKAHLQKAA